MNENASRRYPARRFRLGQSQTSAGKVGSKIFSTLRAAVADRAQVKTRAIDLHVHAHDASHFLLIPQAVVVAGNDEGARVKVQPGPTVRAVNMRLARHGRRFGPDPASEAACTIGGVVANNSSGMNCGITENSYTTLESLTLVLPSGTIIDTAGHDADSRLRALEPELHAGLDRLSRRVRGNPPRWPRCANSFP